MSFKRVIDSKVGRVEIKENGIHAIVDLDLCVRKLLNPKGVWRKSNFYWQKYEAKWYLASLREVE